LGHDGVVLARLYERMGRRVRFGRMVSRRVKAVFGVYGAPGTGRNDEGVCMSTVVDHRRAASPGRRWRHTRHAAGRGVHVV